MLFTSEEFIAIDKLNTTSLKTLLVELEELFVEFSSRFQAFLELNCLDFMI